jgi:hypothetical protein
VSFGGIDGQIAADVQDAGASSLHGTADLGGGLLETIDLQYAGTQIQGVSHKG